MQVLPLLCGARTWCHRLQARGGRRLGEGLLLLEQPLRSGRAPSADVRPARNGCCEHRAHLLALQTSPSSPDLRGSGRAALHQSWAWMRAALPSLWFRDELTAVRRVAVLAVPRLLVFGAGCCSQVQGNIFPQFFHCSCGCPSFRSGRPIKARARVKTRLGSRGRGSLSVRCGH